MSLVEVEVVRPFWLDGRPRAVGDVVAMSKSEAAYAIHLGRAAPVVETVAATSDTSSSGKRGRKAKDGDGQ